MFAVIDIETTGGNAARDRITEIAVILHDGTREEGRFVSLVNPEIPIPPYITDITGIDDAMVESAPRFFEVARQIVELTEGRVFVAHNVNFDYSFIREEFRRLAYDYQRERLCTVRTSRQLIPGHASYSLGRLCAAIGIPIRDRHRALGDAEATAILLERLVRINPSLGGKAPRRDPFALVPPQVPRKILSMLPEAPGVYHLHDGDGVLLLSARSANIRQDVLKSLKDARKTDSLRERVHDITWELTGSEMLAALQLLSGQKQPTAPTAKSKVAVWAYADQRNYIRLGIGPMVKGREHLAEFGSESEAKAALEARMKRDGLCAVLLGLEPAGRACSRFPAGGCEGACMGQEAPETYNARVEKALLALGFPYQRFLIVSGGRNQQELSVVQVENGDCLRYGFIDATQGWANADEVASLLNPFPHPRAGGQIIRQFLPKCRTQELHPY